MADDTSYDNKNVAVAKSAAKKGNKGPKEKSLPHKARKMLHPSYSLNNTLPTDPNKLDETIITPAAPWFGPDPYDDIIELKREYLRDPNTGNLRPNSQGPLGKLEVDKSDLEYLRRKKDKEAYLRELSFAQLLIADDPALRQISAEKAYKIYPELQTVPEDAHKKYVGIQGSLRTILRDGVIRGKDDNRLIMTILDPMYFLPLYPLWDMHGKISKHNTTHLGHDANEFIDEFDIKPRDGTDLKNDQTRRGLFNPVRYMAVPLRDVINSQIPAISIERNTEAKMQILMRLYPAVKSDRARALALITERPNDPAVYDVNDPNFKPAGPLLARRSAFDDTGFVREDKLSWSLV